MKKILLTGGGTGGHIYPLLAIAKKLKEIGKEDLKIYYIGPKNPFATEFAKQEIEIYTITGAKIRRYLDIKNLIDIPKFIFSLFEALFKLYRIMPDVVFSKGGPGSFAVVLAAKFYFIPVIIHESDSIPSLNTKLAAKFAKKIAVSFENTLKFFPARKTILTGNPIREELWGNWLGKEQAKNYLHFNSKEPLVFFIGGSQGAIKINNLIISGLQDFIQNFQIYHQTGKANEEDVKSLTEITLKELNEEKRSRYKAVGFLEPGELKFVYNAADIVVSRAGAGVIFELAFFGKPAILVPLEGSANNHQKINAYEYSKTGAAIIIEETNFTPHIVLDQLKKLLRDPKKLEEMSAAALSFAKPNATEIIVKEILKLV